MKDTHTTRLRVTKNAGKADSRHSMYSWKLHFVFCLTTLGEIFVDLCTMNGRFLADFGQICDACSVTTHKLLDFSTGVSCFFFSRQHPVPSALVITGEVVLVFNSAHFESCLARRNQTGQIPLHGPFQPFLKQNAQQQQQQATQQATSYFVQVYTWVHQIRGTPYMPYYLLNYLVPGSAGMSPRKNNYHTRNCLFRKYCIV